MSPVISGITRTYDFGDDWTHLIALESTHGAAADSPRAVCVAGQRRGPIEDSGGPRGYQEVLDAVGDPSHQRHREASEWLTFIGNSLTDDLIDQSKINDEIAAALTLHPAAASDQLKQLINRCQGLEPRDRLTQLITAARLDVPITIDPETAKAMVQPYCWLLQRVGPNGIKLTKAGFLPRSTSRLQSMSWASTTGLAPEPARTRRLPCSGYGTRLSGWGCSASIEAN